ncbi:MAG TPA: hypothetical protein VF747_01315, partial [Blastocatellia bacterium]
MRRWLLVLIGVVVVMAGSLFITDSLTKAKALLERGSTALRAEGPHNIKVTPWGPGLATIDEAKNNLRNHSSLQRYLKGVQYRMLSFDFVENDSKLTGRAEPPTRYRATFFDYTNNRAIVVNGQFKDSNIEVSASPAQPLPSMEEFDAAVSILSKDPKLGPAIRDKSLQPYPPMPPLVDIDLPTGKVERTVTVGLMPTDGKAGNEVVGVNMIRRSVIRYEEGAPKTSNAIEANCGVPNAGQATTSFGTAGQFEIVISRGSEEIWRFLVIRPSASSGNNKSGIELRDVKYHGKLVLSRANAPILNVQYAQNACGPFRDWSWQEGMFDAPGTDVPGTNGGVRMCTEEPETVLENGTDTGNYRGVAVYDREEVTLVSELNAGWYRYISKWIFHDDGIISPRFGFGATTNSCVCRAHTHHVYWRFDFDLGTAANNYVAEKNQGVVKALEFESMRARQDSTQEWIVNNAVTGEACIIKPGIRDGNYDKFGAGDIWVLRSHFPSEIDDSGQGGGSEAHIGAFLNNETILNQDVVVWYGGHWRHDHFDAPDHNDGPAT